MRIMNRCPHARSIAAVFLALGTSALVLGGCANPPPKSVSIAELVQRPGERSLVDGLRNYENGAFEAAERDFSAALSSGLQDQRDKAVAHKHLAFIACAFNRIAECESHFRAAFAADAGFRLSEAEIGHPVWGPVYRRVAASQPPAAKAK